jgi:hypothetical protein
MNRRTNILVYQTTPEALKWAEEKQLLRWALVPTSIWACTMMIIAHADRMESTLGLWVGFAGLPGIVIGSGVFFLTRSNKAAYVGIFLGNWFFYFGLVKAAVALKNRLTSSR